MRLPCGDDLFAPGIEQAGKRDTAGGRGATELSAAFDEQRLRSCSSGLNGCDMPCGATTDHDHVP